MAYVFCNQCGHRNPPESGFCSSCGSVLDRIADHTITLAKVDPLQDAAGTDDDVVAARRSRHGGRSLIVRSGVQAGDSFACTISSLVSAVIPTVRSASTTSRCRAAMPRSSEPTMATSFATPARSMAHTSTPSGSTTSAVASGDELQVGKFRLVFFERPRLRHDHAGTPLPVHRRSARTAARGVPRCTISKIRFLESQGLIDPERTASGYRKFYDNDVDLLRVILREQRENFLPLRVIRDRLESGAIEDPTVPTTPPRGIRNVEPGDGLDDDRERRAITLRTTRIRRRRPASCGHRREVRRRCRCHFRRSHIPVHRRDSFAAGDLCHLSGLTEPQLAELESYGLLTARAAARDDVHRVDLAIAQAAAGFMQHGVGGRT